MDTPLAIASFWIGTASLIIGGISLWITFVTMKNTAKIQETIDLNNLKSAYKITNTCTNVLDQLSYAKIAVKEVLESGESCSTIILNPINVAFSDLSPYYKLFEPDDKILLTDSQTIKTLHKKEILTYDDVTTVSDIINRTHTTIIKKGDSK